MTDPNTLIAIAFLAGIGTLGVLFTGVQFWVVSRNQRLAQHQHLHQTSIALLFEYVELDTDIQVKLWECYSSLLDSYFTPATSVPDEILKKHVEASLCSIEMLTPKRLQALTKCANLLPADMFAAAQDLYKSRGRMISVLSDTNYEDKHYTLYLALLLYQNSFKARNALISVARQHLGVDRLTVDVHELWDRSDTRTASDIAEKLKETVLQRLPEKNSQRTSEVSPQSMKETLAATLTEASRYYSKTTSSNGNANRDDVA